MKTIKYGGLALLGIGLFVISMPASAKTLDTGTQAIILILDDPGNTTTPAFAWAPTAEEMEPGDPTLPTGYIGEADDAADQLTAGFYPGNAAALAAYSDETLTTTPRMRMKEGLLEAGTKVENTDTRLTTSAATMTARADTASATEGTQLSAGTKVGTANSKMMAANKLPTGAIAKAPTEKTAPTPNPLL